MRALDLTNPWEDAPILFRESTRSTMEDALALAREGCPGGTTVVTDYQEAGRGRLEGRRWHAEPGKNLLFTLLLRDLNSPMPGLRAEQPGVQSPPSSRLPLLVGLAVARGLESAFGLATAIKWPNDVLCCLPGGAAGSAQPGRPVGGTEDSPFAPATGFLASEGGFLASEGGFLAKVAGILCEAVSQGDDVVLLAGVGVNCNQLEFPGEPSAVSLAHLLGREVDRLRLLEVLLAEIRRALSDPGWKAALLNRLYLLGREVTVRSCPAETGRRPVAGTLAGIEDDGALRLLLPAGQAVRVYGGELERSP